MSKRGAGLGVALGAIGVLGVAAVAAASIIAFFARTVVTPPRRRDERERILAVTESTITVAPTLDSLTPGRYSLWFDQDAGHARVGEILHFDGTSVTRELLGVDFGDLSTARNARFSGWFYLEPPDLGFPFEDVAITTPIGRAPAWFIPAEDSAGTWVIQVHGRAVRRQEALRAVPVFRDAGYSSLLVSYRNDGDAPGTPDNRYALGGTEWLDIEAAIEYAIEHGATDIVLMGWSMGGAIVLQAATRSAHAELIRGIVLESPVIDWVSTLRFQGGMNRLPPVFSDAVVSTIGSGWGKAVTGQSEAIDFARLDFVTRAGELQWPILLLHSDDDGFVPIGASRALAVSRPDIVTFVPFTTARHTKLWNYDEARWTTAIRNWLDSLE